MIKRGVYSRDGELIGYVEGFVLYDPEGQKTGRIEGRVVYDLNDNRRWLLDRDAVLDLRAHVIGYLGEPVRNHDY
jgi:hypothetical protein